MKAARPVVVFVALLALQLLVFGRSLKGVGFYLDDWNMLNTLSAAPHDLLGQIQYYLTHDPKVSIRPFQAVYQSLLFSSFHSNPLGYHVFNAVLELICASLLYVCVGRVTRSRAIAFITAVLYQCYPVHDSTHYWVLCHAVNLSLALYLGSLWCALKWCENQRVVLLAAMFGLFAVSIFNYETLLPLSALTTACVWLERDWKAASKVFGFHVLAVGGLVAYQRFVVPMFASAWLHGVHVDVVQIAKTVVDGTVTTSPAMVLPFCAQQIAKVVGELSSKDYASAIAMALIVFAGTVLVTKRDVVPDTRRTLFLGALIIISSFSIFGLNAEYAPTLVTIVNRINTAASIGWCLLAATGFVWLVRKQPKLQYAAAGCTAAAVAVFALTDWSMAQPWVVSWTMQHRIFQIAQANGRELDATRPVILLNCPRYVMWSPVFDGVWDFQSMLQLATGKDLHGNVVSERLEVTPTGLRDVSAGFECGKYPFDKLQVLEPPKGKLMRVNSAEEFVSLVEPTADKFGPSTEVINQWRQNLISASPKRSAL